MSDTYPDDLLYTEEHEWARKDSADLVTVGISQFAVEQLGDVTQVDLPREGETFAKGDVFGSVESVKAVSDLFAPLAGTVTKINEPLMDSPEYVNEDPYDQGWFVQLKISAPEELEGLMTSDVYKKTIEETD